MGYGHVVLIASDQDIHQRLTACAAAEGIPNPAEWVYARRWRFAALPGWADTWESAADVVHVDRPGWRPSVFSDSMLLSGVQAIHAEDLAAEPEV